MIEILGCITQQHDLRLVLLAAALCGLASLTTANMLSRASSHEGWTRAAWLAGAAVVFGSGVWTTHFVAMLAFLSYLVAGYAVGLTTLSFAAVCVGAAGAFWLVNGRGRPRLRAAAAACILGAGVGAMHYTGIEAMWLHGVKSLDPAYVLASIGVCIAFSYVPLRRVAAARGWRDCAANAALLSLGVVVLHFTGMTGLSIQPAFVDLPSGLLIGSALLATVVVAVVGVIVALSLFGSIMDQHLSRRLELAASNLHHLAHHDTLTGLPNRLGCHQQLAALAEQARETGMSLAVLCLDLDRFKQVNDLLGHWAGDKLLGQVGARLHSLVRATDMVARIGGDEFVLAISAAATAAASTVLAERITDTLTEPFWLDGNQVSIGTSIGIAMSPADGTNASDLLRNADTALYQAKKEGRGAHRFFEASMNERLCLRQRLEQDLRSGIRENQLELHYQPLLDVRTKEVIGFETLVRWRHPERGLIQPADFIPIAEESGLIVELGAWVLEQACREAASWDAPLQIAVNLSPVQFRQKNLAEMIMDVVSRTGLAPNRLELEVTESVLIRHAEEAVETLNKLRDSGINISLDDFGTGYSSLSYLRRFPFNKIKLDRSFIQALGEDDEAAVITRAIVALGHSLHLVVTAEGVETDAQLAFLERQDCNQVQGYLIGRPKPVSDIAGLSAKAQTGVKRGEPAPALRSPAMEPSV